MESKTEGRHRPLKISGILEKCLGSLCVVFGKVFGSGLRPSFFLLLFLPGLLVLSTKLITAHGLYPALFAFSFDRELARARSLASPASPSLACSLLLPLCLPLSLSSPPWVLLHDDLTVPPVVFFSRSLVSSPSLPPLQPSRALALSTIFCRMACLTAATAGLSFGLSATERSVLRFGRRRFSVAWLGAFSIIGQVLPSPEEIPKSSPPAPPRRVDSANSSRRTKTSAACGNADFTLSRTSRPGPDCSRALYQILTDLRETGQG